MKFADSFGLLLEQTAFLIGRLAVVFLIAGSLPKADAGSIAFEATDIADTTGGEDLS